MNRLVSAWLIIAGTIFVSSGANCRNLTQRAQTPPPVILTVAPSLEEAAAAVNNNSAKVQSLKSTQAKISLPWTPPLKADLAFARPKFFRLQASLLSPELDTGSNDDLFWFWAKSAQPPSLYYCRHEEANLNPLYGQFPFETEWVIDAFGLCNFDVSDPELKLTQARNGSLEIHSTKLHGDERMRQITVLDKSSAWVTAQHLYNSRGERVASALLQDHWIDPASGAALPRTIQLEWPAMRASLKISMSHQEVNTLQDGQSPLWQMPSKSDAPTVNLADPNNAHMVQPFFPPSGSQNIAPLSQHPKHRGFSWMR